MMSSASCGRAAPHMKISTAAKPHSGQGVTGVLLLAGAKAVEMAVQYLRAGGQRRRAQQAFERGAIAQALRRDARQVGQQMGAQGQMRCGRHAYLWLPPLEPPP